MSPTQNEPYDLAVLGGGIMGLSCAFEAACRGLRVAVLDPNPMGSKASWAAAGILAGRAGVVGGSPFRDFYLRSLASYPDWLENVRKESGKSVGFERGGDYQLFALDSPESRRSLSARESQLGREKAVDFTVINGWPEFLGDKATLKPVQTFHFPKDGYVNNRELLAALESALVHRQAAIFSGHRVRRISRDTAHVLSGEGWEIRAKQILVTAGAWSNEILHLLGWSAPMIPVKGQLASFRSFHAEKAMIHCQEKLYLIPRGKNLIVGSTTEPEVWDETFNASGNENLRSSLRDFFPGLQPEWIETWSGIRPRARDRLPLMGWVDAQAGIAICTGHYKSGISLAPLSARWMSDLLQNRGSAAEISAFNPLRKTGLKRT